MPYTIGPIETIDYETLVRYVNDKFCQIELIGDKEVYIHTKDDIETHVKIGDRIRVSQEKYKHLYVYVGNEKEESPKPTPVVIPPSKDTAPSPPTPSMCLR